MSVAYFSAGYFSPLYFETDISTQPDPLTVALTNASLNSDATAGVDGAVTDARLTPAISDSRLNSAVSDIRLTVEAI